MSSRPSHFRPLSPMTGALVVSTSVFVGMTSLVVAVMVMALAPYQLDAVGLSGDPKAVDEAARWWCYVTGVAAIGNAMVAFRQGRKIPSVTVATTTIFFALTGVTLVLFANAF